MTDPNYTHYTLVVDRSGSMTPLKDDATGGIHSFIEDQVKLGQKATLSLYQFDSTVDRVLDFQPLLAGLGYELEPRGMTRLLDAVGQAVTETGEKLRLLDENARPGKVIVLIVTDGEENSSYEWTHTTVKNLVTEQTNWYKWAFSYIGANQDAWAVGASLGVAAASSLGYEATSAGTRGAWRKMSNAAASYAGGQSAGITYDKYPGDEPFADDDE